MAGWWPWGAAETTGGGCASAKDGACAKQSAEAAAPKKKICCACPETKGIRDKCIAEKGEEACAGLIEAHKACLRYEGFNV